LPWKNANPSIGFEGSTDLSLTIRNENVVTQDTLKSNWNAISGAVKEKYGQITGDELSKVKGNWDQFVSLLQRKTGQTKQQVEHFVDECCDEVGSAYQQVADKVGSAASQAGQYVKEGYESAVENVEQGYEYSQDCAREMVQRRPIETLAVVTGIALVGGVLLGMSLGKRR
jgi:uncharacterized protein YjbJ (UPF0337 family)